MRARILVIVISICVLIPYIATIFFIRTTSTFILLPIEFIAFLILLFSSIYYLTIEKKLIKRLILFTAVGLSLFYYLYFYTSILYAADYIFFKQREIKLNEFVLEIEKSESITQMSDGQRTWNTLNLYPIKHNSETIDTFQLKSSTIPLKEIFKNENIENVDYENLRNRLIETELISFAILENGIISFTIDGFLDNCQGFAYSKLESQPKFNDCGRIVNWKKLSDNWYVWYTT